MRSLRTTCICAALVLCLKSLVGYGTEIVISEFVALNNSTLVDGDGNSSDWIELYNPTETPADLSGWYLTDDSRDLKKWPFPNVIIAPHGYLVVFASGQETSDYVDRLGYLHTNFALRGSGDYLALVKTEAGTPSVVQEYAPNFPEQVADVSYGLSDVTEVGDTVLVSSGTAVRYHVPTVDDAGTDWTGPSYDDSAWVGEVRLPLAGLVITEINTGDPSWVEIQNVSTHPVDASGWFVAVNDASSGDINDAHDEVWILPASISAGEVLYRTDFSDDNYWGSDIAWEPRGGGWAMIVDSDGNVADFVVWGYSPSEIASLNVSLNGFDNITIGDQWRSAAVASGPAEATHIIVVTDDPGNESEYVDFLANIYGPSSTIETVTILVDVGEEWKYFKGMQPPSEGATDWIEPAFDDSGWLSGPTGIGYGDDDDATVLDDMRDNYLSVFCRKEFQVTDPASVEILGLKVDYDDGFIAYLNGEEVGRKNMGSAGEVFTYDMPATGSVGALPESAEISVSPALLRQGTNLLAIQIHNHSLTSSDVSMIPSLVSRRVKTGEAGTPQPSASEKEGLLSADLVIVSERTGNFSYAGDGAWWNEILSTPMMLHSPHLAGSEAWRWLNGTPTSGGAIWDVDAGSHLLDRVSVSNGQVTMFDPDPGCQISSATDAGAGSAIAWHNDHVAVATWTTAQNFANASIPGSARVFFAAPSPVLTYMTDGGKRFLENALTGLLPSQAGTALRRNGGSDRNVAEDFDWTWSPTKGVQNPELSLPFVSQTAPAVTGLGFSDGQSGFEGAIQTDLAEAMHNVNASLWVRIGFQGDLLTPYVAGLTLRMKYDDGFIAYLNGVRVAESNAPATPEWDSASTTSRDDAAALNFQEFNITAFLANLLEGENVLAIHGLNVSAEDDDFLILPELIAVNDPQAPRYMATPTPGKPNVAGALDVVGDTKFSVDRGFYTDSFEVAITTDTPGAEIHYTMDGSEPTATHGDVYWRPIPIAGTTVLRAAAFKPGYLSTNVDTQTYIFLKDVLKQGNSPEGYPSRWKDGSDTRPADYEMDPEIVNDPAYRELMKEALTAIPSISIATDIRNLFDYSTGIYMNPTGEGAAWERPASVEFFTFDGSEEFQSDCGLRIQGGASRLPMKSPKHGLRLLFKGIYGATRLRYPLFGEDAADEFDTVILRAGFNNSWIHWSGDQRRRAQYCRDRFARYTQLAMGQPSSHGRFVHVYLNGMYWGLHDLSERPTAPFMAAYYGGEKEEYDTLNSGDVRDGDKQAWNTMMAMANGGLAGDMEYEAIREYLDVDNLIDFMITNHYGGNHDWDSHNWYAGRKREQGAGYQFFCWDSERILEGVYDNQLGVNNNDKPSRLYHQLRENTEFRMLYADHLHRHFFNQGALTPQAAADRWRAISDPINVGIIAESARWGDYRRDVHSWSSGPYELYTKHDHYDVERARLLDDYFRRRSDVVLQQYRSAGLYPDVDAPVFRVNGLYQHGGLFTAGDLLTITATSEVYYAADGSDPRRDGGTIASGAIPYAGGIALNQTVVVKARARSGGEWSALNEAVFVLDTPSILRITEIMYHPILGAEGSMGYTDPDDFEFIELQNTGEEIIGLAGVRFTKGITFDFTSSGVTTLAPGACVVVVKNLAAFVHRYSNWWNMNIAGEYRGSLANEGEMIEVRDGVSRAIQSFTYDDGWHWATDGIGFSLVPIDADGPGDPNAKEFWQASAYRHGSPGEADPGRTIPEIFVNEVLAHSAFPQVNAIELYNPAPTEVDIGAWWLTDDANEPQKYKIPNKTMIGPYGYVTVLEDDDEAVESPLVPTCFGEAFTLGAHGGEVYLYSPYLRYRHGFAFGAVESGVSLGRYVTSTGEEHFPAQIANTFGSANAGPRVGPVVISEIMYHPAEGHHEFLELLNISDSTVRFHHPDDTSNTWKVTGIDFTFPQSVVLLPGQRLLLVRDTVAPSEFRTVNHIPTSIQIFSYDGALDNAGETISIAKPAASDGSETPYVVVERIKYDDENPWPTEPDGDGPSLERIAVYAYGNDAVNWKNGGRVGGTPGEDWRAFDGDGDGMPDGWEVDNGLDPLRADASDDGDTDGLDNLAEYHNSTNPNDSDSDDDGLSDGEEVNTYGTSPNDPDTDNDGLSDGDEVLAGTDPTDEASLFIVLEMAQEAGGISVEWTSIPGRNYGVYESKNLTGWTLREIVIADETTSIFLDLDAPSTPMRFYRIEALPVP